MRVESESVAMRTAACGMESVLTRPGLGRGCATDRYAACVCDIATVKKGGRVRKEIEETIKCSEESYWDSGMAGSAAGAAACLLFRISSSPHLQGSNIHGYSGRGSRVPEIPQRHPFIGQVSHRCSLAPLLLRVQSYGIPTFRCMSDNCGDWCSIDYRYDRVVQPGGLHSTWRV